MEKHWRALVQSPNREIDGFGVVSLFFLSAQMRGMALCQVDAM